MFSYNSLKWSPQVYNEFEEYEEEEKIQLKIFKVMKSMSKTKINHCLLRSIFNK